MKKLSLTSYPGENVKDLLKAAEPLITRLERCADISAKDMMSILVVLEGGSEERFRTWITNEMVTPLSKNMSQHLGPPSSFTDFDDFKTMSKTIIEKSENLMSEKRYGPALNTPSLDDRPIIKGMKAGVNPAQQGLQQVHIDNRSSSGTSHGGTQRSDGTKGSTHQFYKVDSAEYKHAISLPPGPGEPTKNVMRPGLRRPRTWCPLCNCWYYHDASGHDAWKKKKDEKEQQTSGTGSQPSSTPVAAPAPLLQPVPRDFWHLSTAHPLLPTLPMTAMTLCPHLCLVPCPRAGSEGSARYAVSYGL